MAVYPYAVKANGKYYEAGENVPTAEVEGVKNTPSTNNAEQPTKRGRKAKTEE